jgi:hypothetical protein
MNAALIYLAVFLGMVVLDFLWAFYTLALTRHQSIRAGLFAGMWMTTQGFITVGYIAEHLLLIPAVLGAIVGTIAASTMLKPKTGSTK